MLTDVHHNGFGAATPPATPTSTPSSRAAACVPALFAEAATVDEVGQYPQAGMTLLHAQGLLAAPLQPRHGGSDLASPAQLPQLLDVLRHVGRGNLAVGRLYEGHVNALVLLYRYGSAACIERFAADAANGHLFAVWNTQGAEGVHIDTPVDGLPRLRGSKTFASGAGHVSRALITVTDATGAQQMVVVSDATQAERIDRSSWLPLGMRATASHTLDLSGIAVAPADLLGCADDYYGQPTFGTGAVRFAAVQQGGAEAVFDATRRFLQAAGRVDDPYQRMRLGEMAVQIASGQHWLAAAAEKLGANAQPAQPAPASEAAAAQNVAFAHMTRSAIEAVCLCVMRLAERSVGARGLLQPHPFERMHRDLTMYLRQAGPDAAVAAVGEHVLASDVPAHCLWSA